jgi:starvation-inducible outer membrane lipoprotein
MVVAHSDDEVESKSSPVINDAKPLSSSLEVSQKQNVSVSDGKFLVRLATYLHPDNFDRSKVANLGQISSLEKGPYTIFLLGNYKSIQDAQNTLSQVQSRGFTNAQIVKLQGQEIIRVKTD